MGAAYSNCGQIKVLYAAAFVSLGAKVKLRVIGTHLAKTTLTPYFETSDPDVVSWMVIQKLASLVAKCLLQASGSRGPQSDAQAPE